MQGRYVSIQLNSFQRVIRCGLCMKMCSFWVRATQVIKGGDWACVDVEGRVTFLRNRTSKQRWWLALHVAVCACKSGRVWDSCRGEGLNCKRNIMASVHHH